MMKAILLPMKQAIAAAMVATVAMTTAAHALPGPSFKDVPSRPDEGSELSQLPQQHVEPYPVPWPPRRAPSWPPPPPPLIRNSIRLTPTNGVFAVPVLLNGAVAVNMMVDSGAADVLVSEEVFHRLEATGAVRSGERQYRIADGRTVRASTFIIKSLKVGDIVLEDVPASFGHGSGLLLGQSFLSRLSSWSIDNKAGVLVIEMTAGAAHVLIIR
jgi:clan AA aspartic protease (TIGR02281 family)